MAMFKCIFSPTKKKTEKSAQNRNFSLWNFYEWNFYLWNTFIRSYAHTQGVRMRMRMSVSEGYVVARPKKRIQNEVVFI